MTERPSVQELHEGRWRAAGPLPFYLRFGRCRCECGRRFRNEEQYRIHWRTEHAPPEPVRRSRAVPVLHSHPEKFRKKPVTIEAMRLEPGTDNYKDVCDWIHGDSRGEIDCGWSEDGAVVVNTLEGAMRADPGDWIIRGIKGEFYPCKPDIFDATYESAAAVPVVDAEEP